MRGFAEKEGVKREISKLGLTEREAQELIKQFRNKKTDTGRGDEGVSGIRSGGRKVRTVYEAEKKRGAGEQDLSLKDEVEVSLKCGRVPATLGIKSVNKTKKTTKM